MLKTTIAFLIASSMTLAAPVFAGPQTDTQSLSQGDDSVTQLANFGGGRGGKGGGKGGKGGGWGGCR